MDSHLEEAKTLVHFLPDYVVNPERTVGVWICLDHKSGDGRGIWVNVQDWRRWQIGLAWPRCNQLNTFYRPEENEVTINIGVSSSRGMEAIAKDINRRLLREYDAAYEVQLARKNNAQQFYDNRKKLRDDLLAALGANAPAHQAESFDITVYRHGVDSIRVNSESIEFKLDLPKDVAFELIAWLGEHAKANKFN